ncbi:MAG TPA: hypothetical protein VK142_03130 [Bacillota bacterium]|nr:hypothetical protein [Bacillota bacterium]
MSKAELIGVSRLCSVGNLRKNKKWKLDSGTKTHLRNFTFFSS